MIIRQVSELASIRSELMIRGLCTKFGFATLLILVCSPFTNQVNAAQWQLKKGVDISLESTRQSETRLGVEETDKESRGTIAPFISVSSRGIRTSVDITASVIASAANGSGESDVRPKLSANSQRLSKSGRLSFDSSAVIERRVINSPFEFNESLVNSDSAENVVGWSLGPSYRRRIENTTLGAAYSVGGVQASDTEDSRTIVQSASFLTRSQLPIKKLVAGTRWTSQHLNFESSPSVTTGSVQLFLDYEFRRNLNGEIVVGRDLVNGVDDIEDNGGNLWGVGFAWRPSRKITFEAAYVERYFGSQPRVAVTLAGMRSTVELSWTRELGISAISEIGVSDLENDTVVSNSTTDEEINSQVGDSTDNTRVPLFQESGRINEVVTIAYALNGRVSRFAASISGRQQTDLVSTTETNSTLLELSLDRRLSISSTATLKLTTGESKLSGEGSADTSELSINNIKLSWKVLF